ncbi:MAG: DUF924 family protein [Burkholderiaceae bacterium]
MSDSTPLAGPQSVLDFWFGEPGSAEVGQRRPRWFQKSDAFDAEIRTCFGATIEAALDGACDAWTAADAPLSHHVAYIVVLDQFTRNVYRDCARMVAGDARALTAAGALVARGDDRRLPALQRWFCYLPFEHAEDLVIQNRSLALFADLAREPGMEDVFEWARKHQVIVARFGRFPHRNRLLGRTSTPEETVFLAGPDSSF